MSETPPKVPEKTSDRDDKKQESSDSDIKIKQGEWMLRPCEMYKWELKECQSIRGRFQQYFVHGELEDCTQWKEDYESCKAWEKHEDEAAYNNLLESEKKRRFNRLKSHIANDTWARRDGPPADWAEPLPEWMVKKNVASFLAAKQSEINEKGKDDELDLYIPTVNYCSIL